MTWWTDAARMMAEAWRDTVTFPLSTFPPGFPPDEPEGVDRVMPDYRFGRVLKPSEYQGTGHNCIYPPHPKSGRVYLPGRCYGEDEEL